MQPPASRPSPGRLHDVRDAADPPHHHAVLIITLSLLRSAGTQSASLRLNKVAQFRKQAILLAADIAEPTQADRLGALDGSYVYSGGAASSGPDCTASVYQPNDPTIFDLAQWTVRVANTLPGGTAQITSDFGSPMNYTIVVTWTDAARTRHSRPRRTPKHSPPPP